MATTKDISLVFFGSGPVAAKSLALLAQDFTIEAVVTKPKPAHHRGEFPVLSVAAEYSLPIFTPTNKRELSELFTAKPVSSTIGVVIDYGIIIAQDVIDYFPLGIVNSHFSLLPEWRGADPITFSILSGQEQTGVSLMLITAGLDEGPLLAQSPLAITKETTTPSLTSQLIELSHASLVAILPEYISGTITPAPQESATISSVHEPTFSRKLTKEDGVLDWHKPAAQLEREIRGFLEWPKSRTVLAGKDVVITAAHVMDEAGTPGTVLVQGKQIIVHCKEQSLVIDRLKPAGKAEMTAQAFLAGYKNLFT